MNSTDTQQSDEEQTVQVWLVERTYSDDEQNLIILTYATPDGTRDYRKERALTSFTGDQRGIEDPSSERRLRRREHRETTAAVEVDPSNLGHVSDPETRERYAAEATRMRDRHDPDDSI